MDYFSQNRRRGNSVTQDRLNAPLPPTAQTPGAQAGQGQPSRPVRPGPSYESLRAPSSIRIRRMPSGAVTPRPESQQSSHATAEQDFAQPGRRRSTSEPQRYGPTLAPPGTELSRQRTVDMPTISEGVTTGQNVPSESSQSYHEAAEGPTPPVTPSINETGSPAERIMTGASAVAEAGDAARANRGLRRFRTTASSAPRNEMPAADEYNSDVVDLLDLVGMYI
jgi:hypothetical protein